MSVGDIIDVTVESLGGLGHGIATHKGKPLFISKACAGDQLKVRIVHENKDSYQGTIENILTPSTNRHEAPCRYFDSCGGCTLQQLGVENYRAFKTRILHTSLSQAGYPSPETTITFLPEGTRRRAEFKIHRIGNRVALAFVAPRSHTPVVISQCLVLMPQIEALISPLNKALSATAFAPYLQAVSLSVADTGIDMVLTLKQFDAKHPPALDSMAKELGLARISIRTPDSHPIVVATVSPVEMQLGGYAITLPPDGFLQATVQGQELLTRTALDATQSAGTVVDLFAGMGTYSFPLSTQSKTHAIEGDGGMARMLKKNIDRHKITTLTCEQRDLFKNPLNARELNKFDAAVINPPRVGAKEQTAQLAESTLRTVVMISCNPATFTRDAKTLKAAGFNLASVHGIDQFTWNQHLEIAAVFRR